MGLVYLTLCGLAIWGVFAVGYDTAKKTGRSARDVQDQDAIEPAAPSRSLSKLHCTACGPPVLVRLVTTPKSVRACASSAL
jgi:hypothetical protein